MTSLSVAITQPKIAISEGIRLGINQKVLTFLASLALCLLAYLSLWQNLQIVSKIYQLKLAQGELAQLQKETGVLRTDSLKENSLGNLEKLIGNLGLEKTDRIQFIYPLGTSVVTR